MKRELLYQPARELRVQTGADGSRVISGYAIRYNEPSSDLGGFVEIAAPGLVTDSLRNNPDVLCLRDHDPTILLGRTKSKTLSLSDDGIGLRFTCKLPTTSQAADLAASVDRGDLDGVSFGFVTIEDAWTSDAAGKVIRTLLKVNLFEISPCSFPAYSASSVSIRSCPSELRSHLRSRKSDDEDEDEDCGCDCADCEAGDHCCGEDCDYDDDEDRCLSRSERNRMHMRLAMALRQ